MTLPTFIVIGAMKAGTTTLFQDLKDHPNIFIPSDKELDNLSNDDVLTVKGQALYEKYFVRSSTEQRCGEASTSYSKLPDINGVPKRAHTLLGGNTKLIYLVRNPVGRLLSQYHHHVNVDKLDLRVDEAIQECPELINYSKYSMQLSPWIEMFSSDNIKIIVFEEYIKHRVETIESVCEFLEVPVVTEQVNVSSAFNIGKGRPMQRGKLADLSKLPFYQRFIRPFVSRNVRDAIRKTFLPKAPPKQYPSTESVQFIVAQLEEDMKSFQFILGDDHLPWDLSNAVQEFAAV